MEATEQSEDGKFLNRIGKGVSLVDFNAPWCAPCRAQEPIIQKLSEKFRGKAIISTINIDEHRKIAHKLGIHSIPTLIIFNNGRELRRFIGFQTEETLTQAIENVLEKFSNF